jgi:anti-sigma B factor antagonist
VRRSDDRDSSRLGFGAGDFRLEEDHPDGGTVVLAVSGEVDLHSVDALAERLDVAVEGGVESLVVDLSSASFVDSQGLGALLGAARRLAGRGGAFRLVVTRAEIRRVFEVASLDRILSLDGSREEALARLPRDHPPDS